MIATRTSGADSAGVRPPRAAWRLGLPLAVAVLTLPAGCDNAPSTMTTFSRDDPWSFVESTIADDGLPVVVRGRLGTAEGRPVATAVVAAIRDAMSWTATPNVFAAAHAAPNSVRILVLIGASGGNGICLGEPDGGSVRQGDPLRLTMVLCAGDERISEVVGQLAHAPAVDAARFTDLIVQATGDLFPQPRHPDP